jgi:polysaccharide biosynthesis transport protein
MREIRQTSADQALAKAEVARREGLSSASGGAPGFSPLTSLRKYPFLAILIFLVVTGAGVPIVLRMPHSLYYASSVIYVSPTFSGILREDHAQRPQYDIQQKMLLIPRYDVLTRTIQKLLAAGIDPRLPGESEQGTAERLGKLLEITHVPDSYQISVGLHSKSPRDLAEILNCLTETFMETARSEEFYGEDRRIETLKAERTRLESELNGDLQSRSDIARELGVAGFEQLPADRLVETTRIALDQARRERIESEAEVALLERDASRIVPSGPPVLSPESASSERLKEQRVEVESRLAGLKPKHPEYDALAQELARIDDQLRQSAKLRSVEVRQADEPTSQLLSKGRIELERARRAETDLSVELASDIARVDSTTGEFQRGRDLGIRIEQLRNQINAIDDRLSSFRLEASAPGFLRVSSPARTPVLPEKDNRNKYLAALIVFALAASVGGVVLIDMTHSKVMTASDVEKILGFPPLGLLLSRESGSQQFAEEQFARMVNNIERVFKQRSEAGVFVFTPVGPGPSSARLVSEIARELQARHIRSVVLRAGALRQKTWVMEPPVLPALRNGSFDGTGVSDKRHLGIAGLTFARDNGQPENTGCLPVSGLASTIEEMLLDHELILVEASPLLLSADTEYLATLAAAVTFLTVEAGRVSMTDLKRAAGLMERLRPAGIAAILHGVSLKSSDSQLRRSFQQFEAGRKRS